MMMKRSNNDSELNNFMSHSVYGIMPLDLFHYFECSKRNKSLQTFSETLNNVIIMVCNKLCENISTSVLK